jgi:hypothetical protein
VLHLYDKQGIGKNLNDPVKEKKKRGAIKFPYLAGLRLKLILQMGLAFGYFNGFWWFFCFKSSGFVFNDRVKLYFYNKRVASPPP